MDLVEVEVKLNEFHTREMTDCQKWTICKCEGLQTEDLPLLKGMTINRTGSHRAAPDRTGQHRTAPSHLLTYLLTPSLLPTSAKLTFNGLITMTTFKPINS